MEESSIRFNEKRLSGLKSLKKGAMPKKSEVSHTSAAGLINDAGRPFGQKKGRHDGVMPPMFQYGGEFSFYNRTIRLMVLKSLVFLNGWFAIVIDVTMLPVGFRRAGVMVFGKTLKWYSLRLSFNNGLNFF